MLFSVGFSQRLVLTVAQNANLCIGGQPCTFQPAISVTDSNTGQLDYTFIGTVYVQVLSSPNGFESLYYGSQCGLHVCGEKVVGSSVTASFVSGIATFQNL